MTALETLVADLSRLPGIGPKNATRLAFHIIKREQSLNLRLAEDIATIKERIFTCSECGALTETDPCPICTDPSRDRTLLCVVEEAQDVLKIQSSGIYNGLFHVLGGAINPLEGIGPEKLNFQSLRKRISEGNFQEIIIATNPTEEGDTTALYIRHMLKDSGITLTRLASGLPVGGDLEYADRLTLARSLKGRIGF